MAGSGFQLSGTLIAILAIIAGVIILFGWISVQLVIGIFLIVWGILSLIGKR
jgi:hypothetical protein